MKSLFKTSLVLIALCSLFLGCKKYPKDPDISFRRPIKRLINPMGAWDMDTYYMNGVDSMKNLIHRETFLYLRSAQYISFGVIGTHTTSTSVDFQSVMGIGTFNLIDNNKKLKITINLNSGFYNPFINSGSVWDIEELTLQDLKIKTTINGINYEITFVAGS
ncbi:MAG TPA: hypothetical protein VF411_01000 [Bacteroidia bacterium]